MFKFKQNVNLLPKMFVARTSRACQVSGKSLASLFKPNCAGKKNLSTFCLSCFGSKMFDHPEIAKAALYTSKSLCNIQFTNFAPPEPTSARFRGNSNIVVMMVEKRNILRYKINDSIWLC
jgi:hypothetical protein